MNPLETWIIVGYKSTDQVHSVSQAYSTGSVGTDKYLTLGSVRQKVKGGHKDESKDGTTPVQLESSASLTNEGHVLVGNDGTGSKFSGLAVDEELRFGEGQSEQGGKEGDTSRDVKELSTQVEISY